MAVVLQCVWLTDYRKCENNKGVQMKKKLFTKVVSAALAICMAGSLAACSTTPTGAENPAGTTENTAVAKTGDTTAAASTGDTTSSSGELTVAGTPRSETLIVDNLDGQQNNVGVYNPYLTGSVSKSSGLHQLIFGKLWEINTMSGEMYGDLAETMPMAVEGKENTYTWKMRDNLTWSDGEPLDANDVVYTINTLMENSDTLAYGNVLKSMIKSIKADDDLTVEVETVNPEPKLELRLGVTIWGNSLYILPEHIFKDQDINTFAWPDPISSGPYTLESADTQGYWFLYKKRDDWQNTAVGQVEGEPGPEYILFQYYGTEEKKVLAMASNQIDILCDISAESWQILKDQNPEARAWYAKFPYADVNDPCERGIAFNCAVEPYNNKNVRWALALAIDITSTSLATMSGMLRVSPLQVPATDLLQEIYHKPMVEWLESFELDDGYKPFNTNYANEICDMLAQTGVEGLPETDEEKINTFGIGWWNYDPDEATKLLENEGFTLKDEKWYLPNGEPWQITIKSPSGFEVESEYLATAVADQWIKFGIDVNVQKQDSSTFQSEQGTGNFEVGSYWPSCGVIADCTSQLTQWDKAYNDVPIGQPCSGSGLRWVGTEANDRVTELLTELRTLPSDDEKIVPDTTEILKCFVEEIPFLPMFGTSKFVPYTSHYWTGIPDSDNAYEGPHWWWSHFKYMTPHIQKNTQ